MKPVKIDTALLNQYSGDKEIMEKDSRPCVLVVRLTYKERVQDFIPGAKGINIFADSNFTHNRKTRTSKHSDVRISWR